MITRRASCACGQLTLACEGEPAGVSICHCFACQQRTGSIFGAQARFPADRVRQQGQATTYVRIGDSGGRATFRFCPGCGSTVSWDLDGMPGFVIVAVGAFADPNFPPPQVSIYEARQHPWAAMPNLDARHLE